MKPLLVTTLLILGACGIAIDSRPEPLEIESAVAPVTGVTSPRALVSVPIYLVVNDRITVASRELPPPPGLREVLQALLMGTTDGEDRAGLRTSIPSGTTLMDVRIDDAVATLDLSRDFVAVGGEEEILAVAQIVLTATGVEGVSSVRFEIERLPTGVPVSGGAIATEPVGADDYMSLVGG